MSDKIIASIGTFDGVHRGHRFLLDQLRQLARDNGDATVMAVTFDRHPLALIAPERQPARLTPMTSNSGCCSKPVWTVSRDLN